MSNFKIKQHIIHDSDERYLYEKGVVKYNNDGEKTSNSAWTMNEKIWDAMQVASARNGCVINRYVSIRNFEHAHNYSHNPKKGKPLSAFEYAKTLDMSDDSLSIVNQIKKIVGAIKNDVAYDQQYLEDKVVEPF